MLRVSQNYGYYILGGVFIIKTIVFGGLYSGGETTL